VSFFPITQVERPEVHGHRGCRGLRPENTLPAFLHALALGVDVLEMDVVISADHQVVVSHEPWFNPAICLDAQGRPIPNSEPPAYNMFAMPYADIRPFDCGSLKHPMFPEQETEPAEKPLLRDVFASVEAACQRLGRAPVRYSIEVKSSPDSDGIYHPGPNLFLELVLRELIASGVIYRTTLLCFDVRILRLAHAQYPQVATCLLVENTTPWPDSIRQLGFIPTAFGPDFVTASSKSVAELRTVFPGLRLIPWTVNETADMHRLCEWGVEGITTDYPDRLLALLNGKEPARR